MDDGATRQIEFIRRYGPIAHNDNMYDETIQRAARRAGVVPIVFDHPRRATVMACFRADPPVSVILTGTAGDGKTHLCRQVWLDVGGDPARWGSDAPYLTHRIHRHDGTMTLHVMRDLSAWVPQLHAVWDPEKQALLHHFCRALYEPDGEHVFLIAANDGQLVESWRRLPDAPYVEETRVLFETLLVKDRTDADGVALRFLNLSRGSSAALFDLALRAFLDHEVWSACLAGDPGPDEAFGPRCPIRHNYDLLLQPLVQERLRSLFELCDYGALHVPIRQILLLLSNAVLGHPNVKERLMVPADIPAIIRNGTVARASLYNNIFGGNLSETRRTSITVFDYLERFRIGHETSNRIDNILIFGEADSNLRPYYDQLLAADTFYGADEGYRSAQHAYVEGTGMDKEDDTVDDFMDSLVGQRRGLFFKIPKDQERDLQLWELTVFKCAGEYLSKVVHALQSGRPVEHPIKARLVKGLNRIFVGMLIASDRELIVANNLSFSNARVNRLLDERISVAPRLGERVDIVLEEQMPTLTVVLSRDIRCSLPLHLVRYEFLSRVAQGALPSSFSKECYEDMLAFKSQVVAGLAERRQDEPPSPLLTFHLLSLDAQGNPAEDVIEIAGHGSW